MKNTNSQDKYRIDEIHYRDIYGNLLWKEPMIYRRLFAAGQDFVANRVFYIIKRVSVVDRVQHLNIIPA